MKVTVKLSERLQKMYGYLVKKAAENPDKAEVIMTFVDEFLLSEIQTAKKTNQTVIMDISYNDVSPTSLEATSLEATSLKVVRKSISLENSPWQSGKTNILSLNKPKITRNRSGNGHKKAMKRKLLDWEKNYIRSQFIKLNGIIKEDFCLPIKEKLGEEVSIFQVTGFVTLLHKYVSEGQLVLPNMSAYENHIRTRNKLWARYEKNRSSIAA